MATVEGPARKSYMTKEQLEKYLADLRNNRPQRPSSNRPLSEAARHRFSTVRSSTTPPEETKPEIDEKVNNGPPMLVSPVPPPELTKRETKLLRKHSIDRGSMHKRSSTTSSIRGFGGSGSSIRTAGSPERLYDSPTEMEDSEGRGRSQSVHGGLVGPRPPGRTRTGSLTSRARAPSLGKRDSTGSMFSSHSFRSLAGRASSTTRPATASSVASSASGDSELRKKVSFGADGQTSRPSSRSSFKMPPVHPLNPKDAPVIEKELTLHFNSLAMDDDTVAPLRINKTGSGSRPQTRDGPVGTVTLEAEMEVKAPTRERSYTLPTKREYGAPYPPRKEYVEPWKLEPTQNNNAHYMTNSSNPSPPLSEAEQEIEAEILKDLGRRPLPKVMGPRGITPPEDAPVRRNNTKYGAQVQPPAPPVIAVVDMTPAPAPMAAVRTNSMPQPTTNSRPQPPVPSIAVSQEPEVPKFNVTPPVPTINFSAPPTSSANIPPVSSAPSINISPAPSAPSINISPAPPIPTINFPGTQSAPTIPTITTTPSMPTNPSPPTNPSTRPLPRPLPTTTISSPRSSARGPSATCNHCREPIQGRIVSASSLRFHPTCFRCAHCATPLEHVGFFPEPSSARQTRLSSNPHSSPSALLFYCHLDFHELFSPRCKHCSTPIEGEVVVALNGQTFHPGHFFCAECGDPFEGEKKYVEKDGYAWCTGCYQKRFSGKCRKCKGPVMETVVKALGGEWHEGCFLCWECGGGFGEEGRFYVREVERDGGRRRGMVKEEVPVCRGCEERRVKATLM